MNKIPERRCLILFGNFKKPRYLEHPLVLDLATEVQVHLDHEESVPDAGEALEREL